MTKSDPTTGEIVRALRCDTEANECKDCRYKYPVGNVILCDHEQMNGNAADRLESQEAQIKQLSEALAYANEWHKESVKNATNELRELSGITGELERFREFHERYAEQTSKKYIDDICALTARAEQAENDFKLISGGTKNLCDICRFVDLIGCCHKNHCDDNFSMFQWRGLPQEGERKSNG